MRKLFLGLPVFFIAFVLGYVMAHFFLPQLSEVMPTAAAEPSAPVSEPPAPASVDMPDATASPSMSDQLETIDEVNDLNLEVPPKYSVKLLETGEGYPDEDAEVKNGQKWLGLFASRGEYSLRWTKVRVNTITDSQRDADDKDYSWLRIKASDKAEPLFLVKNAPMLKEGKVTSAFRGLDPNWGNKLFDNGFDLSDSYTIFNEGFYKNFWIGNNSSVLEVRRAKNTKGESILALSLYSGGVRQIIHTVTANYWQVGQLYWVGDLDRDGKPDIYCDLMDGGRALFLSSQADEGKLIKKAAEFYWEDGC